MPRIPRQAASPDAATGGGAADRAAAQLLKLEAAMRQVRSFSELTCFLANEVRTATRAQQVFIARIAPAGEARIEAISSLAFVERSSSLVVELEHVIAELGRRFGLAAPRELEFSALAREGSDVARSYPLPHLVWHPFLDLEGRVLGGMLQARSVPWSQGEITIATHLAGAASFAWLAVRPRPRVWELRALRTRRAGAIAACSVLVLALFPVSMSALAPVEVAPRGAFIVTAGVDGVVETVDVEPNAAVAPGQRLVGIADTVLRNRLEIAEREVIVAEAERKKASQLAFVDMRGRHDLAVAQSTLELKMAEREYARQMLARASVTAERGGVAFFSDKKDLIGRPVSVGEKLMEVVDPTSVELRIDLPVSDAIVLRPGARVKVFLDSDPLNPIEAVLKRADYRARVRDGQPLAFRIVAEQGAEQAAALRLGVRGTAQVYSDRVPLAYYLLRRPIAAIRQAIGL